MINQDVDVTIRTVILFEYYKRFCNQSDNPEMHFYVIPELRDIDNSVIEANATYLIDKNLVRGGVDVSASHSFPWITRLNPTGIKLVEKIADESELKIPELHDELNDKINTQDRVLGLIAYCFKSNEIPVSILNIAKDMVF